MIKIYNHKGLVMVDGRHKNLAFLDKKRLIADSWEYSSYVNFGFGSGVPVIALEESKAIGMYSCMSDGHSLTVNSTIDLTAECYLFGDPVYARPQGSAGLKIYSDVNHQLIFDSRLAYLNIAGICYPNMTLDYRRKFGMLFVNPTYVSAYQGAGLVDELDVRSEFLWTLSGGRLLYKEHSIELREPRIVHSYNYHHGMPPLLVDLTGL